MDKDKLICPPADKGAAESLSVLQTAFYEVKKRLAAPAADTAPLINLLIEHNRITCDTLLKRENHFKYLPFIKPYPTWEEILDLVADGAECGAKEYTSAMLFSIPPSCGKSATAIYLTTYLTAIYAAQKQYAKETGEEPQKVSAPADDNNASAKTVCWPRSLPLLLTADNLRDGQKITTAIARILGFADNYFTSPEALVTWVTSTLLSGYELTSFTLILDDPFALSTPASRTELEQLIKAAGHSRLFKIVLLSGHIPENFGLTCAKYLHHAHHKTPLFGESKKPLFLRLPGIAPLDLRRLLKNLGNKIGDAAPDALSAPWAMSYYYWLCNTFPQIMPKPFSSPLSLIGELESVLKNADIEAYEALKTLLNEINCANGNLFSDFSKPETTTAAEKLCSLGLLNKTDDGYRFFVAAIPEVLLYRRGRYPKTSKLLLYELAEEVKKAPLTNSPDLAKYLQQDPAGLAEAFIELAAEIGAGEGGYGQRIYEQILTILQNTALAGPVREGADFCYKLAERLALMEKTAIAASCYKTAAALAQTLADKDFLYAALYLDALSSKCRLHLAAGNIERAGATFAPAATYFNKLDLQLKLKTPLKNSYLKLMLSSLAITGRSYEAATLATAGTIFEICAAADLEPTLKIEALITAAIAFEAEEALSDAIASWERLKDFLTESQELPERDLYLFWANMALKRLKKEEPNKEEAAALSQEFHRFEQENAPFDYRLLPLAMETALNSSLNIPGDFRDITQRLKERLFNEITVQMVPGYATVPEAISENSLGLLLKNSGQNNMARLFCLNALALYKHYLITSPRTPIHIKNFSVFYYNLGVLYSAMGLFSLSGTTYAHSLKWRLLLCGINGAVAKEPEYKRDLALCYNVLGVLSFNCAFFREALEFYNEATAILEPLAEKVKGGPGPLADDLATIYQNKAVTEQENDKPDKGAEAYFAALQWLNKSSQKAEKRDEARHRIAIALNTCGLRIHSGGKSREGLLACRLALELATELTAIYPHNLLYLTTKCGILCASAAILRQLGKNDEAKKQEDEAISLLTRQIKAFPRARELRYSLANVYLTMSRTSMHRYGPLSPKELCMKAEHILTFLLLEDPANEHYLQTLADCKQIARSYGLKSNA